ncbi:MAG: hypothetical protein KJ578_09505 [Bacteroidetes bacterium]|nr:hypothetical protein [Bacteroidota bacterium]MBU1580181.1 hypothetical protein [Bacteroidota bacterium]MBU2557999.1 hypothetical protein [Bacteroidota bacterium]
MFFFGLLSTNLPYILLGVVYLVSFASFSLKALEHEAMAEAELLTKQIILQSEKSADNLADCFYYLDEIGNQIAQKQEIFSSDTTIRYLLALFNPELSTRIPKQFISHFLFSRPPPAI